MISCGMPGAGGGGALQGGHGESVHLLGAERRARDHGSSLTF